MVNSILRVVGQIKSDVAAYLQAATIERLCRELDYTWRERLLGPVATVHAFLLQVCTKHGLRSCAAPAGQAVHRRSLRPSASSFAPGAFERLLTAVCDTLKACRDQSARCVAIVSGFSMARDARCPYSVAAGRFRPTRPTGGRLRLPVAHLLTLFHFGTGLLQKVLVAPLRTHDMAGINRCTRTGSRRRGARRSRVLLDFVIWRSCCRPDYTACFAFIRRCWSTFVSAACTALHAPLQELERLAALTMDQVARHAPIRSWSISSLRCDPSGSASRILQTCPTRSWCASCVIGSRGPAIAHAR